jgi:hypothetical protein
MERKMRRTIIALGALITAAGFFQIATPARAEVDYPFCRSGGGGEGNAYVRCDYATLQQCQATTSGTGGSCITNPYYSSNANASMNYQGPARRHR